MNIYPKRPKKVVQHQIIGSVLEDILKISDIEYQKRVWVDRKENICDDFEMTMEWLGDDLDPVLDHPDFFGLTKKQGDLLNRFYTEIDAFSKKYYFESEFIDTEEWMYFVDFAKDILKEFNFKPIPPASEKLLNLVVKRCLSMISKIVDKNYSIDICANDPSRDEFEKDVIFYIENFKVFERYISHFDQKDPKIHLFQSFYVKLYFLLASEDNPSVFTKSKEWKDIVSCGLDVLEAFNYRNRENS